MSKTYYILNNNQIRAVQYEEKLGSDMVNNKTVFESYEMANKVRDYFDHELQFNF